jgi:hypothetical protein
VGGVLEEKGEILWEKVDKRELGVIGGGPVRKFGVVVGDGIKVRWCGLRVECQGLKKKKVGKWRIGRWSSK